MMRMALTPSLIAALATLAPSALATKLSASPGATPGSYSVNVDGATWWSSGATEFTTGGSTLSTADGSLKLASHSTASGADTNGPYTEFIDTWADGAFVTTIRQYVAEDMIVFEQAFPKGAQGTSLNASGPMKVRNDVSTAFPLLVPVGSDTVGHIAFTGDMTGSGVKHDAGFTVPTGVTGFGPACFFTQDLKSSVVLSSFSQFMAASNGERHNGTAYGLQASVTDVPPGYSLSFVLAASANGGVNAAFEEWGDKLLARYGKSRIQTYTDWSLNYLGYSTDNGAFYYYQTEDHTPGKRVAQPHADEKPGKTYQQTLIDVKTYADSQAIPYKYILLDSWWYYQGVKSGVTNWVGRPDVFPDGNDYFRNQTGWPIMGHNRFWAIDTVYAKQNGGDYDFVIEEEGKGTEFNDYAWPMEQRFWDDLLYNSSKWGLFLYEQDWLDTEYDNVVHLNTNATAARTWLLQMGTAAARNRMTIQYCMSHCRHIMQSLEIPAVTNARASGDYHPGSDQWKPLGMTGIFAWAVAIAPTKDNYWSTDKQTGSSYHDYTTIKEPFNRLQAAVSTLTKGPVAPSDKIGRSDAALILKSCAADGKLLQGDKPAMAIDSQHVKLAFGGGSGHHHQSCRVTTNEPNIQTTKSSAGYSAWTPMNKKSGGGYVEHSGDYCDCTGHGSCEKWAYSSTKDDFAACEAKCTALNCSCFDWMGPSKPSHTNSSSVAGPDGEVWVTHTTLSGFKFGIAMAAKLNADYTLSLEKDMELNSSAHVHYEANATNSLAHTPTIVLKACDKWDFQLHAVAPTLPNGWTLLGEPSKWVPVSNARFRDLSYAKESSGTSVSVTAMGPSGENIEVAFLSPGGSTPTIVKCVIPDGSDVSIQISTASPEGKCVAV